MKEGIGEIGGIGGVKLILSQEKLPSNSPALLGLTKYFWSLLKLVCALFYQIVIFHQRIALQNLWKVFLISSKNLFSFWRYLFFYIFLFPSFLPVSYCFRDWSKINIKVYDIINCLDKNLITHFVCYLGKEKREKRYNIETLSIERVLNKEHFYGNIMQNMWTKS